MIRRRRPPVERAPRNADDLVDEHVAAIRERLHARCDGALTQPGVLSAVDRIATDLRRQYATFGIDLHDDELARVAVLITLDTFIASIERFMVCTTALTIGGIAVEMTLAALQIDEGAQR